MHSSRMCTGCSLTVSGRGRGIGASQKKFWGKKFEKKFELKKIELKKFELKNLN